MCNEEVYHRLQWTRTRAHLSVIVSELTKETLIFQPTHQVKWRCCQSSSYRGDLCSWHVRVLNIERLFCCGHQLCGFSKYFCSKKCCTVHCGWVRAWLVRATVFGFYMSYSTEDAQLELFHTLDIFFLLGTVKNISVYLPHVFHVSCLFIWDCSGLWPVYCMSRSIFQE